MSYPVFYGNPMRDAFGRKRKAPRFVQNRNQIVKQRRRHNFKDGRSAPMVKGLNSIQQDQCTVHVSASVNHNDHKKRISQITTGKDGFIPGGVQQVNTLFNIRKKDPLFVKREYLESGGVDDAIVSCSLNGENWKKYTCSEDMDNDFIPFGQADDQSVHGEVSTNKIKMTVQMSLHGTVVNNGPDRLKGGSLVARNVPYWNSKIKQKGIEKPDMNYIDRHVRSIHPDSFRVMMQLRKVTPQYLTETMRDVFLKLLTNTEERMLGGNVSFFPTSTHLDPTYVGESNLTVKNLTPIESLAVSKYHDMGLSVISAIRLLAQTGMINGVINVANPNLRTDFQNAPNEQERNSRLRRFIETISGDLGIYESRRYKENYIDFKDRQNNRIQNFLYKYFAPFSSKSVQNIQKGELMQEVGTGEQEGYDNNFKNILFQGGKVAQHIQNKVLLNRTRHIVGTISKGNLPGGKVDGDWRRAHIF